MIVLLPVEYRIRAQLPYELRDETNKNGACYVYDSSGKLKGVISARDCDINKMKFNRLLYSQSRFNNIYER